MNEKKYLSHERGEMVSMIPTSESFKLSTGTIKRNNQVPNRIKINRREGIQGSEKDGPQIGLVKMLVIKMYGDF